MSATSAASMAASVRRFPLADSDPSFQSLPEKDPQTEEFQTDDDDPGRWKQRDQMQ
ncbi:MAG: hypothetical protein HGA31_02470 [Candidatus Moranbacteria bacterium]|nr:hypothetical protein [Candidatus Moranbacteria bacterium]